MQARNGFVPHVEGLRGVAALYVFLYHMWFASMSRGSPLIAWGALAGYVLAYGHFSVAIFIVISGFCLGLPVVRTARPFDIPRFAVRRIRRLYPAYAAALLVSLPPFYIFTKLQLHHIPPASHVAVALISHLLLIHNLSKSTLLYINGPMWSIAVEAQIYVVFALLLVPVWRRFGPHAMALGGIAASLCPAILLHGRFAYTCPWLLGLFAMGFWAADMSARTPHRPFPWKTLAGLVGVVAIVCGAHYPGDNLNLLDRNGRFLTPDLVIGAAVSLFLVASSRGDWFVSRIFATRPLERLGSFSYSLYLIHAPFVALATALLFRAHPPAAVWLGTWILLIPVVLAAASCMYSIFERPFLSTTRLRAEDALLAPRPPVEPRDPAQPHRQPA